VNKSPDGREFILDFIVSQGQIYEWNCYKFSPGHNNNGSILLGFCLRSNSSGEIAPKDFFNFLKSNRLKFINEMITTKVPEIKPTHDK
jgi:hypothetical protein